jgi:hypothetical protein
MDSKEETFTRRFKTYEDVAGHQWLTSVILTTWNVEDGRIMV